MKLEIIKGKNGCTEIEVNTEDINGISGDKQLRLLFVKNKKYRLTLKSYKQLEKMLRNQMWLDKVFIY